MTNLLRIIKRFKKSFRKKIINAKMHYLHPSRYNVTDYSLREFDGYHRGDALYKPENLNRDETWDSSPWDISRAQSRAYDISKATIELATLMRQRGCDILEVMVSKHMRYVDAGQYPYPAIGGIKANVHSFEYIDELLSNETLKKKYEWKITEISNRETNYSGLTYDTLQRTIKEMSHAVQDYSCIQGITMTAKNLEKEQMTLLKIGKNYSKSLIGIGPGPFVDLTDVFEDGLIRDKVRSMKRELLLNYLNTNRFPK